MLFEKHQKDKKFSILALLGFGGVGVVFLVYFAYIFVALKTIVGGKDDITAVFNTIAQIATACAFVFAVYQYRQNGEKERQIIVASEAKMLVERMSKASDSLKNSSEPMGQAINSFTSLMCNLGTDFNALYSALDDDIHKAMVRMRWQDMHYNHLSPALKSLTIDALFDDLSLEKDFKGYSFSKASFDPDVIGTSKELREYERAKKILDNMSIGDEVAGQIDSLYLFEQYFFNRKRTDDLMFGLLSQLSFEFSAPLLAAIWAKQQKIA